MPYFYFCQCDGVSGCLEEINPDYSNQLFIKPVGKNAACPGVIKSFTLLNLNGDFRCGTGPEFMPLYVDINRYTGAFESTALSRLLRRNVIGGL